MGRAEGVSGPQEILRRLELTVTRRLDGLLQGNYLGLVPGHGTELGETRGYTAGDDVRRIDWNVTARTQEPHIRQTVADRELETWLLIDRSPSIDFGTAHHTKADLVLSAAGAIGFLTDHTGNRIGAVLVTPDGDQVTPARGGRKHLMALLHRVAVSDRSEAGTAELGPAMFRLGATVKRRGLMVVISDFLDPDGWQKPLRSLAIRHEVLAIEVVDPRELDLPDVGMMSLADPETGRLLHVNTSRQSVREAYRESAALQRERIATDIKKSGAGHLQLRTDRDWVLDMVRFVTLRRLQKSAAPALRVTR